MQAIRSRDTAPELAVRRILHARGLRYRVATRPLKTLRRSADIVFPRQKLAIFIDGCFWHGCPDHGRASFKSNVQYWPAKIETNRLRDLETNGLMTKSGWVVLRFWEHQDPTDVANAIEATVDELRAKPRAEHIESGRDRRSESLD